MGGKPGVEDCHSPRFGSSAVVEITVEMGRGPLLTLRSIVVNVQFFAVLSPLLQPGIPINTEISHNSSGMPYLRQLNKTKTENARPHASARTSPSRASHAPSQSSLAALERRSRIESKRSRVSEERGDTAVWDIITRRVAVVSS